MPIGVETGPSGVYAEGKMTWAAPGKKTSDLQQETWRHKSENQQGENTWSWR